MIEFARLYFLACELKPVLPEHKLLRLLPPKHVELLVSAVKSGISSGLANYTQLASLYEMGKSDNITHEAFKSSLTSMLEEAITAKENISIDERMQLWSRLAKYYERKHNSQPIIRQANEEAPPMVLFSTGFAPLDKVLSKGKKDGEVIPTDIVTVIAHTGAGKSFFSLGMLIAWKHGSVLLYDPENGDGLVMYRANTAIKVGDPAFDNKKFIFGYYEPEDILTYIQDNPDPGRLVIMDSLHCVCGDGRSPDSAARYFKAYNTAIEMKKHCKLILITTQVKRGADGDSLEAGAASSCIERYSGVQAHLEKLEELEDDMYEYRLFCSKNRNGVGGDEVRYAFDYPTAKAYLIAPQKYTPKLLDNMESF